MIRLEDSTGDEIRVYVINGDDVLIEVSDQHIENDVTDPGYATATLDPDTARKLATALTRCADRVEGGEPMPG